MTSYSKVVVLLGILISACAGGMFARKVPVKAGTTVPAAEAHLDLKRRGENTALDLQAEHLAPPGKVEQGANSYVVWIEPIDQAAKPQNVGSLRVEESERTASLRSVTPYERFNLFVTAEQSENATQPSGPTVLSSTVR